MFCSAHSTILPPSQGEEAAEIRKKYHLICGSSKKRKIRSNVSPLSLSEKTKVQALLSNYSPNGKKHKP